MADKNANSVDKIRDLIFGSQIKDFEAKFNQLNDTLYVIEDKMTKAFNTSHVKLEKETKHSLDLLANKIDDLSLTTQRDKTKLKELIDASDKSLQEQLAHQKDKFVTKLKIIKENVENDNNKIVDNMATMQSEIQATLEKKLSLLSDDKLSRDSMAEMLLDVAMKIQGTDVNTILEQGTKTEK